MSLSLGVYWLCYFILSVSIIAVIQPSATALTAVIHPISYLETLRHKARSGHAQSLYELGHYLSRETSKEANFIEAVKVLMKAADQNHPDSQNLLGYLHERGLAGEVDESKALKYYEMAADGGVARAHYNLGVFHDEGKSIPEDKAKAFQYYMKAADQGIADAQFYVGYFYELGFAVEVDLALALKYYELAAKGGYANAQHNVAVFHELGKGVPVDKAKAFRYYKMAADNGVPDAQYSVGCFYEQGTSAADSSLALKYFLLAADNKVVNAPNSGPNGIPTKNNEAQYKVGWFYEQGISVEINMSVALKYYQLAANGGIAEAQNRLGQIYNEGKGIIPVDKVKAFQSFLKAADQGHIESLCAAGYLLYNGVGVDVNISHGVELYQKSAIGGSVECKELLEQYNANYESEIGYNERPHGDGKFEENDRSLIQLDTEELHYSPSQFQKTTPCTNYNIQASWLSVSSYLVIILLFLVRFRNHIPIVANQTKLCFVAAKTGLYNILYSILNTVRSCIDVLEDDVQDRRHGVVIVERLPPVAHRAENEIVVVALPVVFAENVEDVFDHPPPENFIVNGIMPVFPLQNNIRAGISANHVRPSELVRVGMDSETSSEPDRIPLPPVEIYDE